MVPGWHYCNCVWVKRTVTVKLIRLYRYKPFSTIPQLCQGDRGQCGTYTRRKFWELHGYSWEIKLVLASNSQAWIKSLTPLNHHVSDRLPITLNGSGVTPVGPQSPNSTPNEKNLHRLDGRSWKPNGPHGLVEFADAILTTIVPADSVQGELFLSNTAGSLKCYNTIPFTDISMNIKKDLEWLRFYFPLPGVKTHQSSKFSVITFSFILVKIFLLKNN